MSHRTLGIVLLVAGIVIVTVVFLAVPLHLGNPGFGMKKIAGLVVGRLAFIAGLVVSLRKETTA